MFFHTYFIHTSELFALLQKKTNCNSLTHTPEKCRRTTTQCSSLFLQPINTKYTGVERGRQGDSGRGVSLVLKKKWGRLKQDLDKDLQLHRILILLY